MALVLTFFSSIIVLPVGASLAPGSSIQINSSPFGATVYIDGHIRGSTPSTISYLAYGNHVIFLTLDGYQKYVQFVYVAPYGAPVIVNATLEPNIVSAGGIHVKTIPFNAMVCVDYGNCQVAPATFDNLSGNNYHMLTIEQGDNRIWYDNVMVLPLAIIDINEVLQPDNSTVGYFHIIASPSGGFYCVDSQRCWFNPGFDVKMNQYHTITVVNDGYRPFSTEIYIELNQPHQVKDVNIQLQSITIPIGNIEVNTTPAGGTVCLDGIRCDANVGSIDGFGTTLFVDVAANIPHTVTVNMTGYKSYSSQVSVGEGQTAVVYAPLYMVRPGSAKAYLNKIFRICSDWDLWCNQI